MKEGSLIPKVLLALTAASPLLAQAWLFPKGEGAVTVSFQHNYLPDHVFSKGERQDVGPIHLQGSVMDVDYSLTNKFAVRFGLPYFAGKYEGPRPHQLPIDDGTYHGSFQDFRTEVRYNLRQRPFVLTPFFETVLPSHAYEHYAHSTIGPRLRELHFGANLGRRLDFLSPNAYLQVRYFYSVAERVEGFRPQHSTTEFQLGYFLKPRLSLMALGSWQHPHNGIDYVFGVFPSNLTPSQLVNHDRIALASSVDLGGGVAIAASKSVDVFATGVTAVRVRNGHALAAGITAGVSWRFHTALAEAPQSPPLTASLR